MIDNKLTTQIQQWMETEPKTDEVIVQGADLLLRINRNRMLHQTIVRKPQRGLSKLTYELQKHLRYRLDGLTLQQVRKMEAEVLPEVQQTLDAGEPVTTDAESIADTEAAIAAAPKLGRRADHDTLPSEIQALWTDNAERYKKMKEAFATCQELTMACDRYEYVKMLSETYQRYRADMLRYDSYTTETSATKADDAAANASVKVATAIKADQVANSASQVSSARAYISKNRPVYDSLAASGDTAALSDLQAKIQQRVDILLVNKAAMSDELTQWLTERLFSLTLKDE